MADVTISGEQLKTLTKEIFKEEFQTQQKTLLNVISGNFDITMTEIQCWKKKLLNEKKVEKLHE